MSSQTAARPAVPERGLGYALRGALAITVIAMLIGGALFAWLLLAARGPSASELLPADTQLYAATVPNVAGVVEVAQLRDGLRQGFGVADPASLLEPMERLLRVSLRTDVVTWLGSEMIVAVRGIEPERLRGADPAETLLREGQLLFVISSKNDPQAAAFLQKHLAARRDEGARFAERMVGETTIYLEEGGAPSPLAAFALTNHYIVFSNSADAIEAMARGGESGQVGLAALPRFEAYREAPSSGLSVAIYTDGDPGAELIRAAVRDLFNDLAE
jgi:hypothetical protein